MLSVYGREAPAGAPPQAGQARGRHANDGWGAVHHEGATLDELRNRYEAQRAEQEAAAGEVRDMACPFPQDARECCLVAGSCCRMMLRSRVMRGAGTRTTAATLTPHTDLG